MRTEVLWGVLALLCQQTLVSGHILGRPSSANDLAQLKVRNHVIPVINTPFVETLHCEGPDTLTFKQREDQRQESSCMNNIFPVI